MLEFTYDSPVTVEAALAALRREGARALAGGTDLIAQMREGRRSVRHVVDLKRIGELTAIAGLPDGGVRIGAAASASAVANHPVIVGRYPAVAAAARLIGSWQIQNRATLGGNICNAAPSADAVPPLTCHGAGVELAGLDGRRSMPLESLFTAPGRTVLAAGEILVGIVLPPPPPRSAAAYLRFTPRREMDIAIAGAGAWLRLGADGSVAQARIALASVAPTPMRAPAAEAALVGHEPHVDVFAQAARLAAMEARPIGDTRGSADYRRELVQVLTLRALEACRSALNGSESGT